MTVEELRAAWPVRDIPGYGTCIIIPPSRFSTFWENDLKSQGAVVLYQMLPGGPCTLVRVKNKVLEASGPRTVFEPKRDEPKPAVTLRYQRWSGDENKRLLKRVRELRGSISHRCTVLAKEFARSSCSLMLQYYKLKPAGKTVEEATEVPNNVHTEAPTPLPTAMANSLHEVLVEIQDEVLAMVKEHGEFRSLHEGYAVILEELEELWDEVKRPPENLDPQRLRSEALDVAASAAKFALFVEKGLEAS